LGRIQRDRTGRDLARLAFYDEKADDAQALEFPRDSDNGVLPPKLVRATIELAFTYLADATTATPTLNDKKSVDVGGVKVEWFDRKTAEPTPLDLSESSGIAALNDFPLIVRRLLSTLIVVLSQTVASGWGAAVARRVS
jgi:hypothetical protein